MIGFYKVMMDHVRSSQGAESSIGGAVTVGKEGRGAQEDSVNDAARYLGHIRKSGPSKMQSTQVS